jgi:hypothetical protein
METATVEIGAASLDEVGCVTTVTPKNPTVPVMSADCEAPICDPSRFWSLYATPMALEFPLMYFP